MTAGSQRLCHAPPSSPSAQRHSITMSATAGLTVKGEVVFEKRGKVKGEVVFEKRTFCNIRCILSGFRSGGREIMGVLPIPGGLHALVES